MSMILSIIKMVTITQLDMKNIDNMTTMNVNHHSQAAPNAIQIRYKKLFPRFITMVGTWINRYDVETKMIERKRFSTEHDVYSFWELMMYQRWTICFHGGSRKTKESLGECINIKWDYVKKYNKKKINIVIINTSGVEQRDRPSYT